jgi:hypothetical protein
MITNLKGAIRTATAVGEPTKFVARHGDGTLGEDLSSAKMAAMVELANPLPASHSPSSRACDVLHRLP